MRKTTLGDLQNTLPLGLIHQGIIQREVEFREWLFEQEQQIAEMNSERRAEEVGLQVSDILAVMIKRIGKIDFDKLEMPQRKLILNQAFVQDIFYMWVRLRMSAIGETLTLASKCPHCRIEGKINADLNTMAVKCYDHVALKDGQSVDDIFKGMIKLEKGLTIGSAAKKFIFAMPPRWSTIERLTAAEMGNSAKLDRALWDSSIVGVKDYDTKGAPFVLVDDMLKSLNKRDVLSITKRIGEISAGLDLAVEGRCANCKRDIAQPLRWSYDVFFVVSSA